MQKWGKTQFCPIFLKSVGWVKFRNMCMKHEHFNVKDEFEAYALYKHETGRTVVGMDRKLEAKAKKDSREGW